MRQANNKLIAEFMELPTEVSKAGLLNYYHREYNSGTWYEEHELSYNVSWDWLMPVVERIENLGYEFFIVEDRVKVAHNTDNSIKTIIHFTLGGSKRDATYQAVVGFINKYNKQTL